MKRSKNTDVRKVMPDTPVDKQRIVQAALTLLNKDGMDQLSMRRLAETLGIRAASLYWHIKDKAELMQLLADSICGLIPLPDPSLPWQQQVLSTAENYRKVLLSIRDAEKILLETAPATPKRFQIMESTFRIFKSAGFSPVEVVSASSLINNYVLSFVSDEVRLANAAHTQGKSIEEMYSEFGQTFFNLQDKYPNLVLLAEYTTSADMDKHFLFGLQVILDGLNARLKNIKCLIKELPKNDSAH